MCFVKRSLVIPWLVLSWFVGMNLFAVSGYAADRDWRITSEEFQWHVASGMQVLEDPEGQLTIRDLLQKPAADFETLDSTSVNFGYSASAFWMKVPVLNTVETPRKIIASLDYALLDEVDFYWVQNGRVVEETLRGDSRDLTLQKYDVPHYTSELVIPPQTRVQLYLRVHSGSSLSVPLYLQSEAAFVNKVSEFRNLDGAFFGLAVGLLFYNLFLMVMLRERIYFEYVLFVTLHVGFQFFLTGHAQFFFSDYPYIYERGVYVIGVLSGVFLFQFSRTYLQTSQETPRMDKVLLGFMVFSLIVLVVELTSPLTIVNKANALCVFLGCIILFIAGFIRLASGFKSARYYIVGQGSVLASVMFTALASRHIVPGYEVAPMIMKVGAVAELLFFSVGLADRINRFKEMESTLSNKAAKADAENAARKRYINQINSINKELEAAVKSRSEFLANMSHEIRTPMNGILGMLELIDDEKLDMVERNYVDIARRSGKTLLELINDILDLSKIEADKLELESMDIPVREMAQDLQHLYHRQLQDRGLELRIEIDEKLPECIKGDRTRIWQILTNLTSNAIKFTHTGFVAIRLRKLEGSDGEQIEFAVKDTGIGIPKDKQAQVFESFTQADGSTTRQYGGTGLGLTISRKLIEKMGGELKLESAAGAGSVFYFAIPLVKGRSVTAVEKARAEVSHVDLSGRSVLLVEDNVVNQKVAVGMLKKLGITNIDVCENGADAVVAVGRNSFDVVLMDVQMPVMDGYEASRKIREEEKRFSRPRQLIIAMTAHSMEGDRELCLEAGMDDYIAKPIQKDSLQNLLAEYLAQGDSGESSIKFA